MSGINGKEFAEIVADMLRPLVQDIAAVKTAQAKMLKVGPVEELDAEKGYRILYGETDGEKHVSPWLPFPETGKTSVPLKKGQIVGVANPGGDPRQGMILRSGYSDAHPSPNANMDANVFSDAGVTVTVADGALVIAVGGVTVRVSGEGLDVNGGHVKNDGIAIDKTHRHGGVLAGPDPTDIPLGG